MYCSSTVSVRVCGGAVCDFGLCTGRAQPSDAPCMASHRRSLWSDERVCSSMCSRPSPTPAGLRTDAGPTCGSVAACLYG